MIDLDDAHSDMLVEFDDVEGVGNATVGHLGNVDETVLMDTDIHKGSEVGDVGDDAWQDHALYEIVDSRDILVEFELL